MKVLEHRYFKIFGLYLYHEYVQEFCQHLIDGGGVHSTNKKIEYINNALKGETDFHRGNLGLIFSHLVTLPSHLGPF